MSNHPVRRLSRKIAALGLRGKWHDRAEQHTLPLAKGAYILAIKLDKSVDLPMSGVALQWLQPGYYLYLGSARGPGGIAARVRRHMKRDKTVHWHVDHLTVAASCLAAHPVAGGNECSLVALLLSDPEITVAATGFGNSDCRVCQSHLLKWR